MQYMSELTSAVGAHEEPFEFEQEFEQSRFKELGAIAVRKFGTGAGLAVAGATAAIFMFPAHTHIGGAEASVNLEFGTNTSFDPGGSALLFLKAPLHFGPVSGHVSIDKFGFGLTPGANDAAIQQYAQSFSDHRQDISNAESALAWRAASGAGAAVALALGLGLSSALIKRGIMNHQPDFADQLSEPNMVLYHRRFKLALAGLSAAGIAGAGIGQYTNHSDTLVPSPVFDGTFLEGSELGGLSAPLITKYGPNLIKGIEESDKYYDVVNANFKRAFDTQFMNLKPVKGQFNVLTISDRHCNFGMNRVIRSVAHEYGAVLILDAGDDAAGASDLESPCVNTLTDSVKSIPIVESPGNHDPKTKAKVGSSRMIILKGGKPVTVHVAGTDIRVVGAADPRTSNFGHPIVPYTKAGQAEVLSKVADTVEASACRAAAEGSPASIVMAHDASIVKRVMKADCGLTFGLSGHTHVKTVPEAFANPSGTGYAMTEGSTGGAGVNKNGLTVAGPLLAKAEMSVITFDAATKRPIGYYTITANPDQTIELSEFVRFTDPLPHNVPHKQQLSLPVHH